MTVLSVEQLQIIMGGLAKEMLEFNTQVKAILDIMLAQQKQIEELQKEVKSLKKDI